MRDLNIRRWLGGASLLSILLVLAGCSTNENGQNSLDPKGPAAEKIDNLFLPVLGIAVVIGVLVVAATVVFAIRFRHRPGKPDNPKQIHGSTPLEIGWTIVPALILAVVAVPTVSTIFSLDKAPTGPNVLHVTATGKQWWWQFEYPKQPLVSKAITTSTELHVPVNTPVELTLLSDNVIHSFWIPELAGKRDVVPSLENKMTLEASDRGTYLGQCAEYCGLSHANMRMRVVADSKQDWDTWLADQQGGPAQPWEGEIATLTGKTYGCTNCHAFNNSKQAPYGPNLTHFASRKTFAGGTYEINHADVKRWVLDAPSMIPMESQDCRQPPPATCVGMPSFIKNTPKGQPVMTEADAETIVNYLLGES